MQKRQEEMFSTIEKWKQGSLSRKSFCREHHIAPSTFSYWYSKYTRSQGSDSRQGSGFIKVEPAFQSSLEVFYPNGVKIRLPQDTSVSDLRALIQLV